MDFEALSDPGDGDTSSHFFIYSTHVVDHYKVLVPNYTYFIQHVTSWQETQQQQLQRLRNVFHFRLHERISKWVKDTERLKIDELAISCDTF